VRSELKIHIHDYPIHNQLKIHLFDLNGRSVKTKSLNDEINLIDMENLAAGVYAYLVVSKDQILNRGRIVKI